MPQTQLSQQHRTKLDGIVQQMVSNGESDATIQFVVDDFKKKYISTPDTTEEDRQAEQNRKLALEAANDAIYNIAQVPEPLRGVASAFTQGILGLGKGALDLAKATAFGLDDEVNEALEDASPEERAELWDNFWNWADTVEDAVDLAGAGTSQAKGKFANTSIIDNLSEGNIAAAAELTAEQTASGVASLVPLVLGPGGAAILGASAAGSSFEEDIQDVEKTGDATYGELYGAALAKGGIEFATELVTAGILGKARKMVSGGASKEAVDNFVRNSYKRILGDSASEGVSEGLADTGSKLVDKAVYQTEYTTGEYLTGFVDSAIVGAIIGGGMTSVAARGAERGALMQTTKSEEQIEQDKERIDRYNAHEKVIQEHQAAALNGSLLDEVIVETAKEGKKEVVKEQKEAQKEHERVITDMPQENLKEYAKLRDQVSKLIKFEKKLEKGEANPKEIEAVQEQIQKKKEEAQAIYDQELLRPELEAQVKEADQKLDDKIEEQEATLKDATEVQQTADGKPKKKTAKQKLQQKKTKKALKENQKAKEQLKKEADKVVPPRKKDHYQSKVKELSDVDIIKDTSIPSHLRTKALNRVLDENSKFIKDATNINYARFKKKGPLTRETVNDIVKSEITRRLAQGKTIDEKLYTNVSKAVERALAKEQKTVTEGRIPKEDRAEFKEEKEYLDQLLADEIINPDDYKRELNSLRDKYLGNTFTDSLDQGNQDDQDGESSLYKKVKEIYQDVDGDTQSEIDQINKAIQDAGGLDQLLSNPGENHQKIFALLPASAKSGRAFSGIFSQGNPDAAIWSDYFSSKDRKGKDRIRQLKKAIEERIKDSTDVSPSGIADGAIQQLEARKTKNTETVKMMLPLLGKLKKSFPDSKIIISKARMTEVLIEGGHDPGIADNIKGLTDGSDVYINSERIDAETPIHEFGHIWAANTRKHRPDLYKKGVELVRKSPYWQELRIKQNDPNSTYFKYDDARLEEEAMATAIGQRGAEIFDAKQDQSQWDQLRDKIWDWIDTKLGYSKVRDLTMHQFVTLAATEIVTGDEFINTFEMAATAARDMDNSVIPIDLREVPVGSTRDYSRPNPPVKEFDTHGQWKAGPMIKEVEAALPDIENGGWIGWTTGVYGDAVPAHKFNAKTNARIEAKVNGMRKYLDGKGYLLKQDRVNPGYHIITKKPLNFLAMRYDLNHSRNLGHGRVTSDDVDHWKVIREKGERKKDPRYDDRKEALGKLKSAKRHLELRIPEIANELREVEKKLKRYKSIGAKEAQIDRADNKADELFSKLQQGRRLYSTISKQIEKISDKTNIDFLEATDTGKQKKDKILEKLLNGKLVYKTDSPYKKSKIDAATREIINATRRDFARRGDQMTPAQIDNLITKLEALIRSGRATQVARNKESKKVSDGVKDKTAGYIKETSGVDVDLTPAKQTTTS